MKNKIYLMTLDSGYFGSALNSWEQLNVNEIYEYLKCKLDDYEVKVTTISKILNQEIEKEDIIIYCSFDINSVDLYIKDIFYFLDKKCNLVPSYDHLLAFENKGFQEIYRKVHKLDELNSKYIIDSDELPDEYPYVFKKITGAGSSGVFLIKNKDDKNKIKNNFFDVNLKRKIIKFHRFCKLKSSEYQIYKYRHKGFHRSVVQEFIPDLICDYKVIIFNDRFYVLKRDVRKNDFRASGSGKFHFEQPPVAVLNFAEKIFLKINAPYISLDIAFSKGKCFMIEYQVFNFGPYTVLNSEGFFSKEKEDWVFNKVEVSSLEDCFSYALSSFVVEKL
ncbi:TPA: hypothetical protein ACX6QL_000517 [Photobacterium damselae]